MKSTEVTEASQTANQDTDQLRSLWGLELVAMVCERCDWGYLLPPIVSGVTCPHCCRSTLLPMTGETDMLPYTQPPERVLLFTYPQNAVSRSIEDFSRGVPFAPADLNSKSMQKRLSRLYLPMWLVDVDVKATWKAETGFNYQVVSHQDRYDENLGGWTSRAVEENRIRWEPRTGRLERSYQNVPAPALEEHDLLKRALGEHDLSASVDYRAEQIEGCYLRLPDRAPQDAWTDARPLIQMEAGEECRLAARADQIRQFSWRPEFPKQNWTLQLLPVYTTYYLDDEGVPQSVMINGQNGKISGRRLASVKQGQKTALLVLAVAVVVFLLSLLIIAASFLLPALLVIGVLGLVIALVVGLGAAIPIATVWWFNRTQSPG